MFRTAIYVSTGEDERKESVEITQKTAELNGYEHPSHSHRSTDKKWLSKLPSAMMACMNSAHFKAALRKINILQEIGVEDICCHV
uniref:Transposase n=1 Tax=Haemonchus contortus TaxID=6289 RepID=A0A7I4YC30_HAECO